MSFTKLASYNVLNKVANPLANPTVNSFLSGMAGQPTPIPDPVQEKPNQGSNSKLQWALGGTVGVAALLALASYYYKKGGLPKLTNQ